MRAAFLFDAFGQASYFPADKNEGDTYDPVAFGGQQGYYFDATSLYFLTHRYYDPNAGRFVTRDPIGYKGGLNPFADWS